MDSLISYVPCSAETGVATCNRFAKCGKVFHQSCLATQGYDIEKDDGCILCRSLSKFRVPSAKTLHDEGLSTTVTQHAYSRTAKRQNDPKEPPEQLYIKRPSDKQQTVTNIVRRTLYDRNGCLSNPLHNVDASVAAAILLSEEPHHGASGGGGVLRSAKRKKDATSMRDNRVVENKTRKKSYGGIPTDKDKNDVIVID